MYPWPGERGKDISRRKDHQVQRPGAESEGVGTKKWVEALIPSDPEGLISHVEGTGFHLEYEGGGGL